MKVQEAILRLSAMPMDAELVCAPMSDCAYLYPYDVDLIQEVTRKELSCSRGPVFKRSRGIDALSSAKSVVFVGSTLEKEFIEKIHFKFLEFFKHRYDRDLDSLKYQ